MKRVGQVPSSVLSASNNTSTKRYSGYYNSYDCEVVKQTSATYSKFIVWN